MKKNVVSQLIVILLCVLSLDSYAKPKMTQSQKDWFAIKENPAYIAEEGYGNTVDEADQNALAAIVRGISSSVESQYDKTVLMKYFNGEVTEQNVVQMAVKTFSSAAIGNTRRIIIKNEPDACVGRYVKASDVKKIFAARQAKVDLYLRYAQQDLEKLKIDDALRYLSWAKALFVSIPRNTGGSIEDTTLDLKIDKQMDDIFDKLKVGFVKKVANMAEFIFTYDGQNVASLDFSYFDGRNWSNLCSVTDGIGVAELPTDIEVSQLQIRYEYTYKGQAHIDIDVQQVVSAQRPIFLRSASTMVNIGRSLPKAEVKQIMKEASGVQQAMPVLTFIDGKSECSDVISKVVRAIKSKDYSSVNSCFTQDGLDMYNRLIRYGRASIIDEKNCKYYKFRDGVVARSIKMNFNFSNSSKQSFVEDVVFTFDKDGKIDCLAFALGKDVYTTVMNNNFWQETARMCIVEFLENYKTAYNLKRLDYLKTIFDDDAVIIVGKVVKSVRTVNPDDVNLYTKSDVVVRNRLTKEQYMKNLENCFKSNEYVNVRFSSSDTTNTNFIRKYNKGGEVYGIQVKQDYYSTNYGDTGYLFLMVDLNNPQLPVIKVRTWQDTDVPIDQLVSINHF